MEVGVGVCEWKREWKYVSGSGSGSGSGSM